MRLVAYRPEPGYDERMKLQPEFGRSMGRITQTVAGVVRMVAPEKTGYYVRRVKARPGWIIRTEDAFWHLVEFGSVNNRAYAPLRRGVKAAGLTFVPSPKP